MSEKDEFDLAVNEDGVEMSVMCTPLSGRLYKLDSIPLLTDKLALGDTFEAERSGQTLSFVRVVKAGGHRTHLFVLSDAMRESNILQSALGKVESNNGSWEQAGGLLAISLPIDAAYNPGVDIEGK